MIDKWIGWFGLKVNMWKVQHIICKTRCSSWCNKSFQRGFCVALKKSLWVLICVVSNVKVTQRYAKVYQLNHPSLLLTRLHKAFCETAVLAIPRKVSHSLTLAGMEVSLLWSQTRECFKVLFASCLATSSLWLSPRSYSKRLLNKTTDSLSWITIFLWVWPLLETF